MKIKCQFCSPEETSCRQCGGFKVLLFKAKCACGQVYWDSPGVLTIYDGKRHTTFDGLEIIYHLNSGVECSKCEKKEYTIL